MSRVIDLEVLLEGRTDTAFESGIRIYTEIEPLSGPGGPVKPAVFDGGDYHPDRRWASPDDEPTPVIIIDNVPSQANRLEDTLWRNRESVGIPEFVLDLSEIDHLPAHLPRRISSLQFPHRNADAYLRDARNGDIDFLKTDEGKATFGATAQTCGPLMARKAARLEPAATRRCFAPSRTFPQSASARSVAAKWASPTPRRCSSNVSFSKTSWEAAAWGGRAKGLRKVEARDRQPYVAIKLLNSNFHSHPEAFILCSAFIKAGTTAMCMRSATTYAPTPSCRQDRLIWSLSHRFEDIDDTPPAPAPDLLDGLN